jgi:hypothetical protein
MQFSRPLLTRLTTTCALAAAVLACNMPGPRIGGPETPIDAPQASDDALESFNEKWRDLNLATPDGPFSVTFTEVELTSAFSEAITEQQAQGEDVPISDPHVVLDDGQIYLYTQVELDVTQASGLIIAVPSINLQGLVEITIISAEFGPVDVDPSLLDDLASEIERAVNEPILASPFTITLTQITVQDGEMTIMGTVNQ